MLHDKMFFQIQDALHDIAKAQLECQMLEDDLDSS